MIKVLINLYYNLWIILEIILLNFLSPSHWDNTFSNASVFVVNGSSNPGRPTYADVRLSGVIRPSNFSSKKIFHNLVYCRKSLRETNIILCL